LANTRLREAKKLFESRLYDGAFYFCGYSIELAFKARICKLMDIESYLENGEISRSFKIHDLNHLLLLSGLKKKLEYEISINQDFAANWSLVTNWNEGYRYRPIGATSKMVTQEFIDAVENPQNGVFTWLKTKW